jgi:group I intron endonuclease
MNIAGVYMITNLVNNKVYIGSSTNIHKRIWRHKSVLKKNKHYNLHLQSAWSEARRQAQLNRKND